jgi:hypothetical protein
MTDIRATRSANAQVIAGGLTVLAVAVWIGALMLPNRFHSIYLTLVAALTALPLLGVLLMRVSKGLYTIELERQVVIINPDGSRTGAMPNLGAVCCLPVSALVFLAFTRTGYVFDWWSTIPVVLVGGMAAALMMQWVRGSTTLPPLIIMWAALWGSSTVVLGNGIFDKSAPEIFHTHITYEHITTGRRTHYYITIAPWGRKSETDDIGVTRDFYLSVSIGQEVCAYLHPGAFGARWYEVDLCQ